MGWRMAIVQVVHGGVWGVGCLAAVKGDHDGMSVGWAEVKEVVVRCANGCTVHFGGGVVTAKAGGTDESFVVLAKCWIQRMTVQRLWSGRWEISGGW